MKRSHTGLQPSAALVLVVLVGVSGCTKWEDVELENEGDVCVEQDGDDVVVWVRPVGCIGASDCYRDPVATCDVVLEDGEMVVTSEASWEERTGGLGGCVEPCIVLRASCVLPSVPAGSHTLRHGDHAEVVTIPTDATCDVL